MIEENKDEPEQQRTGLTMTYSQSVNRIAEIEARMVELSEMDHLTPELESEYQELRDEVFQVDEHRKRLERADELAQVKRVKGQVDVSVRSRGFRVERGTQSQGSRADYDRDAILEPDSVEDCRFRNPWDLSEVRTFGREPGAVAGELRARALAAIEKMSGASDNVRQAATNIIEQFDDKDSRLAKQCLVTSSPAYLRAWSKMSRNHQHLLTAEEARALSEVRAMSLTDNAGGYLVPFQLDPTVIITSNGSLNDIRMFARQVVATGDKWHGVSSAAVSWSWDGEAAEVSDDAPSFGQPAITVHKAQGFVPISIEALEDEQNVTQTVATLLAEGKDELEAEALISGLGDGSNQPVGIVTALSGTASEVAPATAETFALADVYALYGALPARHRSRGAWLANNLIYNRIRQFDTNGGAGLWEYLGGDRPAQLLGRPVGEAEAMDGTWDTSATADNFVTIFGNFQNYVIADRVGMTVEFIPHLFATGNNRPNGTRGWYAYTRMGADSVNDNAFRILNLETAS
ncbi:phage major capsid protein [Mycolicibacterium austroafricanum]|uniref:phage major capsid protein n=1 Tax=Mycolicibacterium austroafricanum TaxID=39687 RepID=UPI001ABF0680|nr:phage major capsid protein [Mycolicibacterium austroafricanum]QRZ05897.1 phage major capsid protein [Mycolicibacterium austroafricanum]